jgi:hypothetical protein
VRSILTAALLGVSVALGGVPGVVPPATAQAAPAWRLAGKYRSYEKACQKADYLNACGYDTCIKKQDGYYCVYCR